MVRERVAVLARKDCKIIDGFDWHFGTGPNGEPSDFNEYDFKLGYDQSNNRTRALPFRPTVTEQSRAHGLYVDLDNFFTGIGAAQQRGISVVGERAVTGAVLDGDAHDWVLSAEYTNRALNVNGAYSRTFNCSAQNREAGTLAELRSAFFSVRNRGDGGQCDTVRGMQVDVQMNVGAAVATGYVEGVRVEMQLEANGPTKADTTGSAAFIADQRTDGVYTNLPDAFAVRNRGTSSCKGFEYGMNFWDSRAATCDIAEIRMMTSDAGSLPCVIVSGTATDDAGIVSDIGADTLYADGSVYLSVVDGSGAIFQKVNDVWTAL